MKKNFIGMAGAIIFLIGAFMPLFTAEEINKNYELEASYTVWGYKGSLKHLASDFVIDFSASYNGEVEVEASDERLAELDLKSTVEDISEAEGVDKKVLEFINILAYLMLILGALLILVAFINNKALNIIFMVLSIIGILGLSFFMYVISVKESELGLELAIGCGCYIMLFGLLLYLFSPKKRFR
ncbi:MAG: hypothetical protein JXR58_12250 [Bacteroidales bacterium]|nr:hypothetical protein [Bacteroidales bacterium]